MSKYTEAKNHKKPIVTMKHFIKEYASIVIGIFLASFGLKAFLLNNGFIDGGATGISLLVSITTKIALYQLIILINIPFILLGYKVIGKDFAIKTAVAILGLSIVLAFIEFPVVTNDKLLAAVFGGFFLGAGIGFSIRGGAVIDGTEVLAIYLSRKFGTTIGDIIMIINVVIFSSGAYLLGIDVALYSMITYLSASKTLDFIVEGIEEYIGVYIISNHFEEIKSVLIETMGVGVTVFNGNSGFGKRGHSTSNNILYIVITRLEISKLQLEIEKIDPNSFVVMNSVKDIKGGTVKKRPLKK